MPRKKNINPKLDPLELCIREVLCQLRKERGVSQETFFYETRFNMGRLEAGTHRMGLENFIKICKYLEAEPDEVITNAKVKLKQKGEALILER